MNYTKYTITQTYTDSSKGTANNFFPGSTVYGMRKGDVVETHDGCVIPARFTQLFDSKKEALATTTANMSEKINNLTNMDVGAQINKVSGNSVNLAMVGGVSMGLFAMFKGKSIITYTLGGILVGGMVGYLLHRKKLNFNSTPVI